MQQQLLMFQHLTLMSQQMLRLLLHWLPEL
jgi:hypothetical protein